MMKVEILSEREWEKLFSKMPDPYRTALAICRYTACRSCESLGLRVEDVYGESGYPKSHITFPAKIVKGGKKAHSVEVSDKLYAALRMFNPPKSGLLFPSRYKENQSISYRALQGIIQNARKKCGLQHKKIGTHSARRSTLTEMSKKGIRLEVIRRISNHSRLDTLKHYLEVSDEDLNIAVNVI